MSESKLASKNILSNYGMFIAKMVVGIIALPACLHAYGQELYGLYLISFGLSVSMTAFDFGASKSVFRYVVEFRQDKDENKFSKALSAAFSFNLYSSLLIAAVIFVLGLYCNSVFKIDSSLHQKGVELFSVAAINAIIITIATVPLNILNANAYFHKRNKLQIIPLLLNIILVIYLYFHRDLHIILYSSSIVLISVSSLFLDMYLVKREKLVNNIPIKLITNRSLFTAISAGYNYKVFLFSLLSFLSVQADKLIIAGFFSVSAVTIYTIITKPYYLLKAILSVSYPVIQPKLSQLNYLTDKKQFSNFSIKIIRSSFFVFLLGISFLSIYFKPALALWLGTDDYAQYTLWGVLSMGVLALSVLYSPFSRTLFYTDNISKLLNFSVISVSINMLISIALTIKMGFAGVIIGTAVQILMEFWYFNKLAEIKMNVNTRGIYSPKLLLACLGIIVYSIGVYLIINGNMQSEIILLLSALITSGIFIYILYKFITTEKLKTLFSEDEENSPKLNPVSI